MIDLNDIEYNELTGEFFRRSKNRKIGANHGSGYLKAMINKKVYLMHRLAFLCKNINPDGFQIDHINGNTSDNRWENLRLTNQKGNNQNLSLAKNNKSGFTGVFYSNREKKWKSEIQVDQKKISLGYFKNLSDAVIARCNAEKKYGFHENHGSYLK